MGVRTAQRDDAYKNNNRNDEVYSDFNHTFVPHPNTGQISKKVNVDAVKLSLRNLLLTNKYERVRNPEYGTNIRKYLFERFDGVIDDELRTEIEDAVNRFEPRVRIIDIYIDQRPDENSIYIDIQFAVLTVKEVQNLELTLYRVR